MAHVALKAGTISEHDPDGDTDRSREPSREALSRGKPSAAREAVSLGLVQLCQEFARHIGAEGAAVVLMSQVGSETTLACSDERARHLAGLELTTGEGPTRDAFARARPVLTPDLSEAGETSWPGYSAAAAEAGLGAVFAFPLQIGAARFGVLAAYFGTAATLSRDELDASLVFAARATELLLDSTAPGGPPLDVANQSPQEFRSEIYQAQGMVMVSLDVGLAEALSRMRAHAFVTGQDLPELATSILAGGTRLSNDRN